MRIVGKILLDSFLRPGLRSDRAADKLARHDGRGGVVEVELELVDVETVDVAADDDGIRDSSGSKELQQTAACGRIAVPAVGPGAAARARQLVELRHARLLRDHVPLRARVGKTPLEPALLGASEHAAPGRGEACARRDIDGVRAAAAAGTRAGVPGAVLPVIENE